VVRLLSLRPHCRLTDRRRFKLHLRSKFGEGKTMSEQVPPLPPNKTVIEVFADFLKYLLKCAESYIKDTHPNGVNLWAAHSDDIHFVLSHPNGWEGKEQSQMRQAAIKAGLVPNTSGGHERISFVTEGEASLHFTIENGVLAQTERVHHPLRMTIECTDDFHDRAKESLSSTLEAEPLMLVPTAAMTRTGRELLKKLPQLNVCAFTSTKTHSHFVVSRPLLRLRLCNHRRQSIPRR